MTPSYRPRLNFFSDLALLISLIFKKRGPIYTASHEVYQRLPLTTLYKSNKYLIIALAAFLAGIMTVASTLALEASGAPRDASTFGVAFLAALIPIAGYLFWMRMNDRLEPEPLWLVALAFGWGAFSVLPALIINSIISPLFVIGREITPAGVLLKVWSGYAGFTEEPLKMLGVYLIATHASLRHEYNDHLDGLVYGVAAGLGFAFAENILYITRALPTPVGGVIIPIRALTASMHMFATGVIGFWIGYLKVHGIRISLPAIMPALIFSALFHAAWNTIGMLDIAGLVMLIFVFVPLIIYSIYKMSKEALLDEYYWGYASGYAPVEK